MPSNKCSIAIAVLLLVVSNGFNTRTALLRRTFVVLLIVFSALTSFAQSISGTPSFCPGGNTILTATGAAPGSTYQWQRSTDGGVTWSIISPNGTGVSYTVTSAASYRVIVTTGGTPETYGPVAVVENVKPVADFSFAPNGLCSNVPVNFSNNSSGTGLTYTWDFNDPNSNSNNTSTATNPSHIFIGTPGNGPENFSVKLTATANNGCDSIKTLTVTTLQTPSTAIGGTGFTTYNGASYFTSCTNTSATLDFSNQSTTRATNANYRIIWGDNTPDFNSTANWTLTNHTYTVGTFDLTYVVTGNNGCKDTAIYKVFIGGNPAVGLGNPGNTSICSDNNLSFPINNTSTNTAGTTYTVSFNDGSSPVTFNHPPPDSVKHFFVKGSCGTNTVGYPNSFSATIVASNPCLTSQASVVPIYVSQKPKSAMELLPRDTFCVNTVSTITNTGPAAFSVTNGTCNPGKTVWSITPSTGFTPVSGSFGDDFGTNTPSLWVAGANTIRVNFNTVGVYTIKLKTGSLTCGIDSITKVICVNPQPTGTFNTDQTAGCAPLVVNTTATDNTPFCGVNTYQWQVTSVATAGCTSPSTPVLLGGTTLTSKEPKFQFNNPGTYTISLTIFSPGKSCSTVIVPSRQVVVRGKPFVTLTAPAILCQNGVTNPTATVTCNVATGTTYNWTFTGATTSSSNSQPPGSITFTDAGIQNISLAVTNECGITTETQPINIVPRPDIVAPNPSQVYCPGASVPSHNFAGSLPGTAYTWTNSHSSIGLAASGSGNTIPPFTATNGTTNTITATITMNATANGCTNTSTFTITVNPKPAKPVVVRPVVYCQNSTASPLSATASANHTLTWYDAFPLNTPLPGAPTPITTTVGTTTYYVIQENAGGCKSDTSRIVVTIAPGITNNSISADQIICSGVAPSPLAGTTPSGGTGTLLYQWQQSLDNGTTWNNISPGGTGSNYAPGTLTATTLYRRIVSGSTCRDTSNAVTITIQGILSNYAISASQTICNGEVPALLTGQSPAGGDGTFSFQWESSVNNTVYTTISGATQQDYQPPSLTANTWYRRKTTSGVCSANSSSILITINPRPVINPVTSQVVCNSSSMSGTSFSATPATGITYTWVNDLPAIGLAANGSGNLPSFTPANNTNPKEPLIANISVTPTYTSGGVGCSGNTTAFSITVLPAITIQPINNVIACPGENFAAITPVHDAGPHPGSSVSYVWNVSGAGTSLTNGNGFSIPTFTATNNGTSDLVTSVTITPVYQLGNKICNGIPYTFTITVKPGAPPANAGPDMKLCDASSYTLQAIQATGSTGTWTQHSGSLVTITTPTSPTTTITGLAADQTYQFVWTVAGFASCPTTTDTVTIINRPAITTANAGADKEMCDFVAGGANSTYTLAANSNASRSYETTDWTIAGSANGATINNAALPNAVITFTNPGTYTLVWSISNDAGCIPSKDTIMIRAFAQPVAGSVLTSTPSVCSGQSVTVTATGITGNVLMWQYQPSGSTGWIDTLVTTPAITFNNVTDTFNIRIAVESAGAAWGCTTVVYSNPITINVAPPTNAGTTGPGVTACKDNNNGTITLSGNVGAIVKWQFSTDNGATWTDINNTTSTFTYNNLSVPTWYRAAVKSGTCAEAYSSVTIIDIIPAVSLPVAGPDQSLCDVQTFTLSGSTPLVNETGAWTQITGPPVVLSAASATNPVITGVVHGTYRFRWTLSNNICPEKSDTVEVVVYPPNTNNIDTATQTICSGQPVTITGQNATGGNGTYVYQWQQSIDGGATWVDIAGQATASATFIPAQTVMVRRLVTSGPCIFSSLRAIIIVQPPIENNVIAASQDICINTAAAVITGNTPTGANGLYNYLWQQSADGGLTWTTINGATSANYDPGVLVSTTTYRRIVSTSLCTGPQASNSNLVAVTVNPDARAVMFPMKDSACAPFDITPAILNPTSFPNNNSTYAWYADDALIGTAITFPGYTIVNGGDTVVIKMVAISRYGCRNDSVSHTFFTITKPEPSFEASDTVDCGPLTVTFTNTSPDIQNYRYHWNFGNGLTSNLANPSAVNFATNPNFGDTVYTVSMTVFSACDTLTVYRYIRVKSKPKALFTPDKSFGCSPMTVTFSNISIGSGMSYEWIFGDGPGFLTNNAGQVQHIFNTAVQDTFYTKLVASNECGSDTQQFAIVVSSNAIRLDVAVNGNEVNGCSPHTVRFINNSSGATSFRWDFGDGNILNTIKNLDTIPHTYTQTGTFTVTVFASNGCSDTTSTETIRVFAKPVVDFAYMPSPICVGDSIQFTNQSDTITGVTWKFGDGNTSTLVNPKYRYATPGTYTVTLVGARQYSAGNACTDSTKKTITVLASLPGSFTVSDSVSSCVPFPVTFTNQIRPSVLTTWDFGNGRRDTGDVVTHIFNSVGSFIVTMTATAAGGCTYTMTKTIVVNGPAGTFTYDHGVICGNVPVRFQVNATGTDSILYNFGDGTSIVTNIRTVYHTYTQAGNYVPSVTLLAGANGTCRLLLQGADTIKPDLIKAGFREAMVKDCGNTRVAFTDTSRAYAGLKSWLWNFGNGNTSAVQTPVELYTSTNSWQVRLIVTGTSGCSDTITKTIAVKVNNKPVSTIVSDSSECTSQQVLYTSHVLSQDTIGNYQWRFTNGAVSNAPAFSNSYAVAGNYTATLITTTIYGCSDTTTKAVVIHPTPIVRATLDKVICRGQSIQLNATGASSYSWGPLHDLSCYSCANPIANPTQTTAYEVTGTNTFGCASKDTVNIRVVQPFNVSVSGKDSLCIGQSTQLTASGATRYVWTPATGLNTDNIATPVASPTLTTAYTVVGYDAEGCFTDTARITVAVGEYPTIDLGADKVLATGTQLPLQSVVTNGPITRWQWTPSTDLSCTACPLPVATVKKEITYRVVATNAYHCSASDTISIKVFCESTQVFIPNLFTPDNDGINDILMVRGTGIKTIKNFRIFNRWGELVFERSNFSPNEPSSGWNGMVKGQKAPPDVYVYTCEVLCENDVPFVYKGNTAIIK